MRFQRYGRFAGIAAAAALALTGCGGANAGQGGSGLTGDVKVDGSSTVFPMTAVAAEKFMERNPGVQVTVNASGTGGGFEKFCRGETDINDASRPIEPGEKQACEKNGVEYDEFVVAGDALTVVVSEQNTWAKCLTVEQLKEIWKPGSKVDNWSEVNPKFPNAPLKLFGPGTDSGTFDYFTEAILGEEGKSRSDYAASEDDNVIVQGVAGSKGGLGYFGYSYYIENKDKLNAVKIDGGNGCVAPTVENAQTGKYKPLSRPLSIYPSTKALQRDEVEAFVTHYVKNAQQIAASQGFVPLDSRQQTKLESQLDKLKSAD